MDSDLYLNFYENQRLGMNYNVHSSSKIMTRHHVRKKLYKDMIQKPRIIPEIYNQRSFDGGISKSSSDSSDTGGIFNIDFNPDSTLMGAACERKCFILFDPTTKKQVAEVKNAHDDCVNCIRFLDNRLLATCSDDTTVALWDARYLKKKLRSMKAHSNWVKNIEYSSKDHTLVTSGFDGAIFAWDINKFSEKNDDATNVFYTGGLMRMRLTPSSDKMVISTINGYLIIIHDLCLDTLAKDLSGFKPNMYRMLQLSGNPLRLRVALNSTPLFHAKQNRVELVSDFAPNNEAEIVSSLQLHPQGWVAVSRNVNADEATEWCCVHDIQSYPVDPDDDKDINKIRETADQTNSQSAAASNPSLVNRTRLNHRNGAMILAEYLQSHDPLTHSHPDEVLQRPLPPMSASRNEENAPVEASASGLGEAGDSNNPDPFRIRIRPDSDQVNRFLEILNRIANHVNQVDPQPGPSRPAMPSSSRRPDPRPEAQQQHQEQPRQEQAEESSSSSSSDEEQQNQGFLLLPADSSTGAPSRFFSFVTQRSSSQRRRRPSNNSSTPGVNKDTSEVNLENAKIHHNVKRLTHYLQESNSDQGKGFIKEVSFSPDGLILASPYDHGVRLLAFNDKLEDLSYCSPSQLSDPPRELYVVGTNRDCHQEVVLSTAFSPVHYTLVTGCRGGSIVWHQPRF